MASTAGFRAAWRRSSASSSGVHRAPARVTSVASLVLGTEAAEGQIVGQLDGLLGEEAALVVQDMLRNANQTL